VTQTILSALLPFVVVALGALAAHFGMVKRSAAPLFAEFVVGFALPLALFEGVLNVSVFALVARALAHRTGAPVKLH